MPVCRHEYSYVSQVKCFAPQISIRHIIVMSMLQGCYALILLICHVPCSVFKSEFEFIFCLTIPGLSKAIQQITRPPIKWAVSLVIADGHSNFPRDSVGMYELTYSILSQFSRISLTCSCTAINQHHGRECKGKGKGEGISLQLSSDLQFTSPPFL